MLSLRYLLILLLVFPPGVNAKKKSSNRKSFTGEYTYNVCEADSKLSSRTIASREIKNLLVQELGTYIDTTQTLKAVGETSAFKENIIAISSGITRLKILDEKWNGETYTLKASVTVNLKSLPRRIDAIRKNKAKLNELKSVQKELLQAQQEIKRIKEEYREINEEGYDEDEELELKSKCKESYTENVDILLANEYFEKAYRAALYNKWNRVRKYCKSILVYNPSHSQALNLYGLYYSKKGNKGKSIKMYRKSLKINTNDPITHNNIAQEYAQEGDVDKAIEHYKEAIRLAPEYSDAHFNLAYLYWDKEQLNTALKHFEAVIAVTPEEGKVHYYIGVILEEQEKEREATIAYMKAARYGSKQAKKVLDRMDIAY